MIVGIGVDLVDCRRIQRSIYCFGSRFLNRLFLPTEQEWIGRRLKGNGLEKDKELYEKQQALHYAKSFAAKESVLKALGIGLARSVRWHHIEIGREPSGRPHVVLHAVAREYLGLLAPQGGDVKLSLSDEWPYVQAFVVITQDRGRGIL